MTFVALVTGGNKGIGFEIVKKLCEHIKTKLNGDGIVFLGARNSTLGEKAVKDINDVYPNMTRLIKIDVTEDESVDAAAAMLDREGHKLNVLINNAGFAYPSDPSEELDAHSFAFRRDSPEPLEIQFRKIFEINYFGVRRCMNAFLPLMKSNGRIVTIASIVGKDTWKASSDEVKERIRSLTTIPQLDDLATDLFEYCKDEKGFEAKGFKQTAYGNSKMLVTKLMELYAKNAPKRILINSVCPGWCKSDMAGWERPPKTAAEGAETPLMLALLPETANGPQGEFWSDGQNETYLS